MNDKTNTNTETPSEVAPEHKYVLISGKHSTVLADGSRQELRAGDEIMMTEAQAALFANKFQRAVVPDTGDEPSVAAKKVEDAPPAAPTYEQLTAAIESLPGTIDDPDLVYDSAEEAKADFVRVFGDLLNDDHFAAIAAGSVPE